MPAYQFNVEVNGAALLTQGQQLTFILPPTYFVSPLGIMTRGLSVGLGDQWRYAESSADPNWIVSETGSNPG